MSQINRISSGEAIICPETDIAGGEVQKFRGEILELINEKLQKVTVDFSKVEIIDSSGIGVFISAQNTLKKQNGILKVVNVSPDILKMFKIMRLDKHFDVSGRSA